MIFLSTLLILEALAKFVMVVLGTLAQGSTHGVHLIMNTLSPRTAVVLATLATNATARGLASLPTLPFFVLDWYIFNLPSVMVRND